VSYERLKDFHTLCLIVSNVKQKVIVAIATRNEIANLKSL